MRCGVLALQGDWAAHGEVLARLADEVVEVRSARDLESVDALVIPGGESTTMLRLMRPEGLAAQIGQRVASGMPVLGTCAGLILLARRIEPTQPSLGVLDVDVMRNAYGRQVHSSVAVVELHPDVGQPREMDGVFIRAPKITRVGDGVEVLGRCDGEPVIVRQGRIVASTFHPELARDDRLHRLALAGGEAEDV